jgi:parallel beta-helix repeat protein
VARNARFAGITVFSDNNIIKGNTVPGCYRGISLSSSNGNTVSGNTATGNSNAGIGLVSSSNNNFSGKTAPGNSYDGNYLS